VCCGAVSSRDSLYIKWCLIYDSLRAEGGGMVKWEEMEMEGSGSGMGVWGLRF
jgi:hypothetical protein